MANVLLPLLLFPRPDIAIRTKRRPAFKRPQAFSPQEQASKLDPQFEQLQSAIFEREIQLQGNTFGLEPELALVLDINTAVSEFASAVRTQDGLEWLGDFVDEYPGMNDEGKASVETEAQSSRHVYLIMTNMHGLRKIRSLFKRWKLNPGISMPIGYAPWKNVFSYLNDIRPWGEQDRLKETGLIDELLTHAQSQTMLPFEAELWHRKDPQAREANIKDVLAAIFDAGGKASKPFILDDIAYIGILGEIPSEKAATINQLRGLKLFHCDGVKYARPIGQCSVEHPNEYSPDQLADADADQSNLPQGDPVVALLDGLPHDNHPLLANRLEIDDPDNHREMYQILQQIHGTAMASLICHGDLNDSRRGQACPTPVYVRPIMLPSTDRHGKTQEQISENVLPVDLIHRAVLRLFEGTTDEPPAAPSVRVINISLGNRSHLFYSEMSAWARLLDWLSSKLNILFIVSAGNCGDLLTIGPFKEHIRKLEGESRARAVLKAVAEDTLNRRLLSPAESINALTIGAVHADNSDPKDADYTFDPYTNNIMPTTYNRHGPGFNRSIKPDLFAPGGRQFFSDLSNASDRTKSLRPMSSYAKPGLRVAAPGEKYGSWHTRGTSCSAALTTRAASQLYEVIRELRATYGNNIPPEYDAVLLKTMLVHGAQWGTSSVQFENALKNKSNSSVFKGYLSKFWGYGQAEFSRVMECAQQRVTILGVGKLLAEEANVFALPLPQSLIDSNIKASMAVTLSWLTPVDSTTAKYRIAQLSFDFIDKLSMKRVDADHNAVRRGTVQHEIFVGKQFCADPKASNIAIKVSCRKDAADFDEPIRFALAVTLEAAEAPLLPIYYEVRNKLEIRVPDFGDGSR